MSMEQTRPVLRVRMLGGLALSYGGREIALRSGAATKPLRLLAMLCYAKETGLHSMELWEQLEFHTTAPDITNILRVTVASLRRFLKEQGIEREPCIYYRNWRYYFDPSIPLEVDVLDFCRRIGQAEAVGLQRAGDHTRAAERRSQLLLEAMELYQGHFLPEMQDNAWAQKIREECLQQYRSHFGEVESWLQGRGEYGRLLGLYGKAAQIFPYEGWQEKQMECLRRLGHTGGSLRLYEETAALYTDVKTGPLSGRLLGVLGRMGMQVEMEVAGLEQVVSGLQEDAKAGGAYYCGYPGFVECYRASARMMERTGDSAYLMLCTLTDEKEAREGSGPLLREASEKLLVSIGEELGCENVYTRYSLQQYLMLVHGVSKEECAPVQERIRTAFRQREKHHRYRLSYRTAPVMETFL